MVETWGELLAKNGRTFSVSAISMNKLNEKIEVLFNVLKREEGWNFVFDRLSGRYNISK